MMFKVIFLYFSLIIIFCFSSEVRTYEAIPMESESTSQTSTEYSIDYSSNSPLSLSDGSSVDDLSSAAQEEIEQEIEANQSAYVAELEESFLRQMYRKTVGDNGFLVTATVGLLGAGSMFGMYFWYSNYPDAGNVEEFLTHGRAIADSMSGCYKDSAPPGYEYCVGRNTWHNSTKMMYGVPAHLTECHYSDPYNEYPGGVSHWEAHIRSICSCSESFFKGIMNKLNEGITCTFDAELKIGHCARLYTYDYTNLKDELYLEIYKWVPQIAQKAALDTFYTKMKTYAAIATPVALTPLVGRLAGALLGN